MERGDGSPQSPLHSASVLLLRDAPGGLEVFLIERHGLSDVHGGAYVFPGGKVDREDLGRIELLDQPADSLHAHLAEPALDAVSAAALYVAAIRELFEESGVLLAAAQGNGAVKAPPHPGSARQFQPRLDSLQAPLLASCLTPWSRWVTPASSLRARKHFDARFFVAALPAGQDPVHDDHEATASVWLTPAAALRDYWEERIQLAPPQIMLLAQLTRYPDVQSVLTQARREQPARIQPEVFEDAGAHIVCFPGDARHSQPARLLPGPTRLRWRGGRYEPEDGLQALIG